MRHLLLSTLMLSAFIPAAAMAEPASKANPWMIRGRIIDVKPQEDSSVNIGGDVDVDFAVVPEVDFSYFLTDHIAAELILATSKHEMEYNGATDLGSAWALPPTVTLQYHFTPDQAFSPYVGAGVNYTYFYGEDTASGFTDLEVDGGLGYAFQAGADYWLNDNWGVNVDVKKVFLNVDAKLNGGAIRADVDLDPWIIGAGVSYRF